MIVCAARKRTLTLAFTALAGCALYSPKPLPQHVDVAAGIAPAAVASLDMNAVATLAVLNNPDLQAARAKMHVAAAQAFAAGILPEPQLNFSLDHPQDRVHSAVDARYPEYNAYGYGLAIDLRALLTHSSMRNAADAAYRQAQSDLLWQEWQTVAQARTLYATQAIGAARRAFFAPAADLYTRAVRHSQLALAQGNVTLEQVSTDESVLVTIHAQQGVAERNALQAEQSLRALLGLRPDVTVPLQPLTAPDIPERVQVAAAQERLPQVRPDLRALQEGYRNEEANLRVAILSQFPNITVGFTRARDVSNVHTVGGAVTLTLPLFDRGRGEIAIQRATRAQLRAEYQARLDQASSEIWQLWNEMRELHTELGNVEHQLPQLKIGVDNAARAYANGNLLTANYFGLVSAYFVARSSQFDLLQSLWSDSIALATLTGTQVQPIGSAHADSKTP
jgi:multidrug efflux system outer membrane protein